MNIIHIDTERTWRGGENQVRFLMRGLLERGIKCHVAVPKGSVAEARLADYGNVLAIPMRGSFDLTAVIRLKNYCVKNKIELIDAHTSHAHTLSLLLKTVLPHVKLVVHRRVDFVPGSGFFNRMKYLSYKVDKYVAISNMIREILSDYGIEERKLAVARSAVDGSVYGTRDRVEAKSSLAARISKDASLPFIGNASFLSNQKGYPVLLKALSVLKDKGTKFHCVIAGNGELWDSLHLLRRRLDLEEDVTFLGFVEDVPSVLSGLDILCVSSNTEGLGTIVLDGIHAGCAVAATETGGIPEMIIHQKTGLLSPVGDGEKLAENLQELIDYESKRKAYAEAAAVHIKSGFSLDSMVEDNLSVYRELIG